jgi:hypothetical protein
MSTSSETQPAIRYWGWALAAVALGAIGYVGYVLYPTFDLPARARARAGLLALAAVAGIASFFSPCTFPLLVSMLARPLGSRCARTAPAIRAGAHLRHSTVHRCTAFLALTGAVLAAGAPQQSRSSSPASPSSRIRQERETTGW